MNLTIVIVSISLASSIVAMAVGGIKIMQFISDRPKREEVNMMIQTIVGPLKNDLCYIRDKVDELIKVFPKKRL